MFKNLIILALLVCAGFNPISVQSQTKSHLHPKEAMDVTITIDGNASESDLSDIKCLMEEHGLEIKFNHVERKRGQITGIKIEIYDDKGSMTSSQISLMDPIPAINFGRKDGHLFIEQGNSTLDRFAFYSGMNALPLTMEADSIFSGMSQSFTFSFDELFDKDSMFILGGQFQDMAKLQEKMRELMESRGQSIPEMDWSFGKNKGTKYRFKDDPNLEKLIMIDGKEASFDKLNALAKNDLLDTVDVLKSQTAMSIYGKKARDGAIIATTKD
ncbi:MAG: hypothetical protein HKO67_06190 [Flavobacteriaceae bacterium]|nr:hypothetical protein [Flavobacteriaceae bacterium]NNL80057.1 hypothetical protein [Flavobacteriaceae bacterium]